MVEDARARDRSRRPAARPLGPRALRSFVFDRLLESRALLTAAGTLLYLYEASGVKALVRGMGLLKLLGRLGDLAQLAPSAEPPFFFSQIGRTFPADGRAALPRGVSGRLHRQRLLSRG